MICFISAWIKNEVSLKILKKKAYPRLSAPLILIYKCMSHNERKSVPVPSVELKPTSQALRTNKQKSGKNPVLHRPSFFFSSFFPSLLASAMGVQLWGCILQSCLHRSSLTHAAHESSPNIGSFDEKKTMPELLVFLTFCTKFLGAQWHGEVTGFSWELWLYATQRGRLKEGTSLGSGCWQRFGNLFQQPSIFWYLMHPPLASPWRKPSGKHHFCGLQDEHSLLWEGISETEALWLQGIGGISLNLTTSID